MLLTALYKFLTKTSLVSAPKVAVPNTRKVPEAETSPTELTVRALLILSADDRYKTVPVAFVNVKFVKIPLVEVMVVPDALVKVKLVTNKLVEVALIKIELVANKFVLVTLVKIPVLGVVFPIGVLSIVPPLMVKPATTIASVIELLGRDKEPVTAKLVVVTEPKRPLVEETIVKFVLVVTVSAPPEN